MLHVLHFFVEAASHLFSYFAHCAMEEEQSPKQFGAHPDSTMETETEMEHQPNEDSTTDMETQPDGDSPTVCVISLKEPNSSFLSTHQEFERNAQTSSCPSVSSMISFCTAFPVP